MTQIDMGEREERVRMIRDSAASIVPEDNNMKRIRALRFTDKGADRSTWQEMCDMGWVGIRLSEEEEGIGLGMTEYSALLEELGKGLVPEPLIDAILVTSLLTQEARKQHLSGDRLILPVGFNYQGKTTVNVVAGKLQGVAKHVYLANVANGYLVYTDQGLALVDAQDIMLATLKTQDGGHFGTLTFDGTKVLAMVEADTAQIISALDDATLGNAAYLLGVMQTAFDQTLSYLTVRKQFGRAIGSFQVLQHRAVDLKIQIELTRAIINQAAAYIDNGAPATLCQKTVSTAKIRAANTAFSVTRQAIQFHGGVGYTDELDIGLFLRKSMVFMNRYGSVNEHRQRYIALNKQGGDL